MSVLWVVSLLVISAWLVRERTVVRRLAALDAATAQAAKFHALLTGMPDGIMVLSPDLTLEQWNEHWPDMVGVPRELVRVGMPIEDILRSQVEAGEFGTVDIEVEVGRRMALWRSNGHPGVIERRRPNGRTIELRRRSLPNGGFVTLYSDITSRRDTENQLRQAQKMEAVGHLTGGIAHDFNNLLAIVGGNLELAQSALTKADLRRAASKISGAQSAADRAVTIAKRLLAFARRQSLDPEVVDVNQIVLEMSDLIRYSVGTTVQFEAGLNTPLWQTLIDAHQLENALLNLAINARDAMPKGGKLVIGTFNIEVHERDAERLAIKPGEYVLVEVSDEGVGMTSEQTERAFEPFYTTKAAEHGSGLGLPQVFGFIQQSAGYVKLDSQPGVGTTVGLYIPRHQVFHDTEGSEPAPRITEPLALR